MSRHDRAWSRPPRYSSLDREILAMPGPVWLLALWCLGVVVVLGVELILRLNDPRNTALLAALLVIALATLVALVTLRRRTPAWFLHFETLLAIGAVGWVAYRSASAVGAVTTGTSLIALTAFMGWWLRRAVAATYLAIGLVWLLIAYAASDRIPELSSPWLVIAVMSIFFLFAFSALVDHAKQQTVTDPLTGLLNRSGMQSYIDGQARASTRAARAIVAIDLDGLKAINDKHGHLAGDRILADFGRALRAAARAGDTTIRSGGDEFIVIAPGADAEAAHGIVTRLRAVAGPTFSYGLTDWPYGEPFDDALARADGALYAHKAEKRTGQ